MERLLRALLGLHGATAVVLVSLLPLLESSTLLGVVVPGETAMLLGGVLAYFGRVPYWVMLAAGSGGAIVGDTIGYWVGRRWGERLMKSRAGRRLIDPKSVDRAKRFIHRHGFLAIALGRFPPGLRSVVPSVAGMAHVSYGRFFIANVLGGTLWAGVAVTIGYFAGSAWRRVAHYEHIVTIAVAAVVAFYLFRFVRRGQKWRSRALAARH